MVGWKFAVAKNRAAASRLSRQIKAQNEKNQVIKTARRKAQNYHCIRHIPHRHVVHRRCTAVLGVQTATTGGVALPGGPVQQPPMFLIPCRRCPNPVCERKDPASSATHGAVRPHEQDNDRTSKKQKKHRHRIASGLQHRPGCVLPVLVDAICVKSSIDRDGGTGRAAQKHRDTTPGTQFVSDKWRHACLT